MATADAFRRFHHHRPLNHSRLVASSNGDAPASSGRAAAEISDALVGLLRDHAGKGPTRAKTVLAPDVAVVTLHDCLTRAELTLSDRGHLALVRSFRDALHEAVRPEAEAAVAAVTGRTVLASRAHLADEAEHAVFTFSLQAAASAAE